MTSKNKKNRHICSDEVCLFINYYGSSYFNTGFYGLHSIMFKYCYIVNSYYIEHIFFILMATYHVKTNLLDTTRTFWIVYNCHSFMQSSDDLVKVLGY